jgi:hypothetical protein
MAISGKVKASTVAASLTTIVSGILAPHVFWSNTPADIQGLILGTITGAITFGCGWLAKHGIDAPAAVGDAIELGEDLGVPFTSIPQAQEVLDVVSGDAPAMGEAKPLV